MPSRYLSVLLLTVAVLGTASSTQTPAPSKPNDTPRVDPYGDPLPPGVLARCGSSRLLHGEKPAVLFFTPDKKFFITGSSGRYRGGVARLLVWEVATGKLFRKLTMKRGDAMDAILSADGLQLECACGDDKQVEYVRWELATGREVRRGVLKVPLGRRLLTMTLQKDGILWVLVCDGQQTGEVLGFDLATGTQRSGFPLQVGKFNRGLAFSSDGWRLAISNDDRGLQIHSLATGRLEKTLQQPLKQAVMLIDTQSCLFSPDGRWLVRTVKMEGPGDKEEQELELWAVDTGKRLVHVSSTSVSYYYAAFTPDSKRLLIHHNGNCQVYDLATGKVVEQLTLTPNHTEVAFSPDGQTLAAFTFTGILSFWDMASKKKLPTPAEAELYFHWRDGITFRQGKLCLDGADYLAWDPLTGRRVPWVRWEETPKRMDPPKSSLDVKRLEGDRHRRFSSDGQWVAFRDESNGHIHVWNLKAGREVLKVKFEPGDLMDFSSDGRWLAVSTVPTSEAIYRTQVFLWDVTSGKFMNTLKGHEDHVQSLAFSPDGRMLATGGQDTTLRLWETSSGQQRYLFTGHETAVETLGFTPDGRLLAAHSFDAPIFIWEVHGHQVQPLTAAEMEKAWLDLHSSDASLAFKAIQRLAATPKLAVPFLQARLQPAPATTAERVRQLITQLDSPQFTQREKAAGELQQVADQVLPQLRQALQGQLSTQARRRLEEIVTQAEKTLPDLLRSLRAMEVLEWIGTPEVLPILDRLAGGAAEATLTQEAKASAQRLRKKATP